jgi:hypothetical protein
MDVGEGSVPCQEVVERAAEAVDVGPAIYLVRIVCLFGRHVVGCSHHPGRRNGRVRIAPGQPEVDDLQLTVQGDDQVVRLDVPVDHPAPMGVLQSQARLVCVVAS